MTDIQQLQLLMKGVNGWNQWRNEYPDTLISLQNAVLSAADLRYVNLSYLRSCTIPERVK